MEGTQMSERSEMPAEDPYGGRTPTSHERQAGQPWDASYSDGPAPWDLGRPQPAIARLAAAGGFAGEVLDVGCGSGENALLVASLGLPVLGVDVAETALAMAREKAAARSIEAEFLLADALRLDALDRKFDTVLDCGVFHAFDDEERRGYVASLASVTDPGATLHLLCLSDAEPEAVPHPVGREELAAAFDGGGWSVAAIRPERIEVRFADDGVPAWLARIERIEA
jgi:SAM-dependent methyltransferase